MQFLKPQFVKNKTLSALKTVLFIKQMFECRWNQSAASSGSRTSFALCVNILQANDPYIGQHKTSVARVSQQEVNWSNQAM